MRTDSSRTLSRVGKDKDKKRFKAFEKGLTQEDKHLIHKGGKKDRSPEARFLKGHDDSAVQAGRRKWHEFSR